MGSVENTNKIVGLQGHPGELCFVSLHFENVMKLSRGTLHTSIFPAAMPWIASGLCHWRLMLSITGCLGFVKKLV